jgi:hypothetical protein
MSVPSGSLPTRAPVPRFLRFQHSWSLRPVRHTAVAAALVVGALLPIACSPAQTASYYREPMQSVTPAQQVSAWFAFTDWERRAGSNDPVLVCIRSHESADWPNPWAAYNPTGPYYGAYQWLQGSWDTAAAATGRPDLVGSPPIEPSVAWYDQDAVTLAYHQMTGDSPWGNRC